MKGEKYIQLPLDVEDQPSLDSQPAANKKPFIYKSAYAFILTTLLIITILSPPTQKYLTKAGNAVLNSVWATTSEEACELSTLNVTALDDPAMWTVEASEQDAVRYFTVSADASLRNTTSCLKSTILSARLLNTTDDFYYMLDDPQVLSNGIYRFAFFEKMTALPASIYTLQVTLEFGRLEGGLSGNVCQSTACTLDQVAAVSSPAFVGKQVSTKDGIPISFSVSSPSFQDRSELPMCQAEDFRDLKGYWQKSRYFPLRCNLGENRNKFAFTPPLSSKNPRWIHFVGDSNSRNVYANTAWMLSRWIRHSEAFQVRDFFGSDTKHDRPIFMTTAFATGQKEGSKIDPNQVDLILSFSWWYPSQRPQYWQAEGDDLLARVDTSIPQLFSDFNILNQTKSFFGQAALGPLRDKFEALRQHRTFISLGSHSVELSLSGGQELLERLLDRLENQGLLFEGLEADEDRHIRFQKTTSVQSGLIPDRFGNQALLRNSVLINRRNDLLDQDPRSRGRTIGFDSNSIAFHPKRDNAVHFMKAVYDEWSDVVMSESQT